ncbi:MAG: ShlB/FhaC/HecB family hemolysin secretion/activation protein [Vampirovibrionales bacterium]|nr:ShlB/FhaC/HecB family hemolysin secretion/activation protein [Vampirovibrionales bacterium]
MPHVTLLSPRLFAISAFLGLLAASVCGNARAMQPNLPDAPRPQTGGEWAQVYTPVDESFSALGPQTFLDPIDIKWEGDSAFIDKPLLDTLKAGQTPSFSTIAASGADARQTEAMQAAAQPFVGKPLSLEDYQALAKAMGQACEQRHRLCKIFFAADGDALEAVAKPLMLDKISVNHSRYFRAGAIRYQLGLRPGDPVNLAKIEKRLRLIQDNPDIHLQAQLKPGPTPETVTLDLDADNHLPAHLTGYWNNLDQYYYGTHQGIVGITAGLNNTLGLNDSTLVGVIPGGRASGVFLQYQAPLNAHGTRLMVNFSKMKADPAGEDYEAFRQTGSAWTLSPGISQVLYNGKTARWSADLNLDIQQFKTLVKKSIPIEKEQLRTLRAGLQFDQVSEQQELSIRNEVSVGLDILGGTPSSYPNLGNPGGGSQFFKYLGAFYYLRNLPHAMSAVLNGTVQWSPDTLPSPHLGAIGGTYYGRGYREALISGDTLMFVSGELRFPCPLIPRKWKLPYSDASLRDKIQLLTFADYGYAKINDRTLADDPTNYLVSVGVGIRAEITRFLDGWISASRWPSRNRLTFRRAFTLRFRQRLFSERIFRQGGILLSLKTFLYSQADKQLARAC